MTSLKIISAVLVLAAFAASPASAWEAVSEPGAFSFYHPNADVLNVGPSPGASNAMGAMMGGSVAGMHMSVRRHGTRRY
jgi:hypothetical protein